MSGRSRWPRTAAALACAALLVTPSIARAQWPDAGIQVSAGITSVDSKGALGASAGLSRSWGPVVGSLLGDIRITDYRSNPSTHVDPVTGQLYCGSRRVNNNAGCPADIDAVGGGLAELGLSLAPYAPVVLSRGYRFGPVSEAYFAATLHWAMSKESLKGIFRVAVGGRTAMIHAGLLFDLDQMMGAR
jgi:hypothetical protein